MADNKKLWSEYLFHYEKKVNIEKQVHILFKVIVTVIDNDIAGRHKRWVVNLHITFLFRSCSFFTCECENALYSKRNCLYSMLPGFPYS